MRPILFTLGLTLICVAFFLGYGQMQREDASLAQAALPIAPQTPSGPATRQLELTLAAAQSGTDTAVPEPAPTAPVASMITLAPKGRAKGARFVKAPTAD